MSKALILSLSVGGLAIALGPVVPVLLAQSALEPRGVVVPKREAQVTGKTYALVIGISSYEHDPPVNSLHFADKDAETFATLLREQLGGRLKGGLKGDELQLLTNENATRTRIDDAVKHFAKHASFDNTLVLFVAAHGVFLKQKRTLLRTTLLTASHTS